MLPTSVRHLFTSLLESFPQLPMIDDFLPSRQSRYLTAGCKPRALPCTFSFTPWCLVLCAWSSRRHHRSQGNISSSALLSSASVGHMFIFQMKTIPGNTLHSLSLKFVMARTRSATKSAIPVHQGYARARRLGLTPNDIAQDAQAWASVGNPPTPPPTAWNAPSVAPSPDNPGGWGTAAGWGDAAQDPVWGYIGNWATTLCPRSDRAPRPLYDLDEIIPTLTPTDLPRERPRRRARRPQSAPVPNDDNDNAPRPLYDIDVILATLTLDDPPPQRPDIDPPPYTPTTPRRPISSRPTVTSSPSLYLFESPTQAGVSSDWSQAAHATQGISGAHVDALRRPSKPATTKRAWVVFRGRRIGVCDTWATAKASVNAYRFALHQGYPDRAQAVAAFEFTQGRGWTCEAGAWSALPVSPRHAPMPIPTGGALPTTHLSSRRPADPYYVVFKGINPGVFGTSVECALNVLGVSGSVHQRAPTYLEALEMFQRAEGRGESAKDKIKITWRVTLPPRSAEQKPHPNVEILPGTDASPHSPEPPHEPPHVAPPISRIVPARRDALPAGKAEHALHADYALTMGKSIGMPGSVD
ncbi:hypothetical protein B0H13DRAFT_1924909 [Mycena leptocephala]|nr:hypothetical protein B0H13DRAFT_1924909 [Mycena leptocephala]